jgi:hypothetical protein
MKDHILSTYDCTDKKYPEKATLLSLEEFQLLTGSEGMGKWLLMGT